MIGPGKLIDKLNMGMYTNYFAPFNSDESMSEPVIYTDNALLGKVLEPYYLNCHYLKNASVECHGKTPLIEIVARGVFSIPESCYTESTGHFNAVEFNICYNQLAYYLLAECFEHELLPVFSSWSREKYYHHHLYDFYIVNFSSTFRKSIDPLEFEGSIEITKVKVKGKTIFIQTKCHFQDKNQGSAEGKALLAIVI